MTAILLPFLCGCQSPAASSSFSSVSEISSSEASSSEVSSISESSSSSSESSEPTDGVYDFYCINDFHGSVVEQMNGSYYESGIAKYFGKLKEYKAKDPEHTIILSAGDMFQGSLESNDNYGRLVIEAMNNVGFDAMTVGNHEFDYGPDRLLNNISLMDFPVLGGNIIEYDDGPTGEIWKDAFSPSTIIERGGNKIGIVGMIGYGQTSSITSSYVQDITFESPYLLAQEEATRLREEENCSLVVYVIHDDMTSCQDYAKKAYFDGVFCGHKHSKNNKLYDSVPFVQSYCNGEAISHFQITISDGAAVCTDYGMIMANKNWNEDAEIAAIRDSYILDPAFVEKASAVAGTIEGTLAAKEGVSNLVSKAIYEKYSKFYPNLRGAIQNGLRAPLTGEVTYRDIYKAAPFNNTIVIATVLGSEIVSRSKSNCFYGGEDTVFHEDEYYTIACISYVLYHQNNIKSYDYFPSLNYGGEAQIIADFEDYPFDIAFNYIHDDLEGKVVASDFLSTMPGFSASLA